MQSMLQFKNNESHNFFKYIFEVHYDALVLPKKNLTVIVKSAIFSQMSAEYKVLGGKKVNRSLISYRPESNFEFLKKRLKGRNACLLFSIILK